MPAKHLSVKVPCFECKGPIHRNPIRMRLDGRYHCFSCTTCQRFYLERYRKIRSAGRTAMTRSEPGHQTAAENLGRVFTRNRSAHTH